MNQHGSISFIGPTDLVNVDLANDVVISEKYCEVYPENEDIPKPTMNPEIGQKLNKPAIVRLNNVRPKEKQTTKEKEAKLRRNI